MSRIILGNAKNGLAHLDLDVLLRTRLLIQGNSGSGKSWLIRRLAEQLFGKVQIVIIDPEGEFATLRESFGYVLVGKGGETPADPRSAKLVAEKLLEVRASAVCDLYEMKTHDRHRWVKGFLDAMISAPKNLWHPVVVVVDESHQFCPEKGTGESEASEAMVDLATRGRKRGFCPVFATQRLGKLRKDAAAELLNVLVGMTFIDVDRKRAAEALGIGDRKEQQAFFDSVKTMEAGNFYALGRAICKDRLLVKVGPVETTHPESGSSKHAAGPPPAPEKIRHLLPKLADLPREAEEKAKTESELRREIRDLRAQISARPKDTVEKVRETVQRVEVPVLKDAQIRKLERAVAVADEAARRMADLAQGLSTAIRSAASRPETPRRTAVAMRPHSTPPPARLAPRARNQDTNGSPEGVDIGKAERKILGVLAQFPEGCDIGKIALLAGYRQSGGFKNSLSNLRTLGYITGANSGMMAIADAGLRFIDGQYDPLPSGRDLAEYWLRHPSLGICERKVLSALLENREGLPIGEIAELTGYSVSGGFKNSLSNLRTAGILVGRNNEVMFANGDLLS